MLNVYITFDIEVWCDGWDDLDGRFPESFRRYVYGRTPAGEYGLPFQVGMLDDQGLKGVFFVEPLFSTRFGPEPLAEVLALIPTPRHEIQLHLHTEWVDEARDPILPGERRKRQHLFHYDLEEQVALIRLGRRLLLDAGVPAVSAFRAGGFGIGARSLDALAMCGIFTDSSYNECQFGPQTGIGNGKIIHDVVRVGNVVEVPMTVYRDGAGRLRHTQITACSSAEMESLLWRALEQRRRSFVILCHNRELLDGSMTRVDRVAVNRFSRLCRFLAANRDCFQVRGLADAAIDVATEPLPLLQTSIWSTGRRMAEQLLRRAVA